MAVTSSAPSPLVSVIIPAYCSERFVRECLVSLQEQDLHDFECIVVDDFSPQADHEIAGRFASRDNRFRLIRHDSNQGVSEARNSGLKAASGEFVLFLNADDKLLHGALSATTTLALRYKSDVVRTVGELWFGRARTRRQVNSVPFFSPVTNVHDNQWLRETSQLKGLLIRRQVLARNRILFDRELILGEDIEFMSRVFLASERACLSPLVTYLYRKGHESLTTRRCFSERQWRSFGEYQSKIAKNYGGETALRTYFALEHLEYNMMNLTRAQNELPCESLNDVIISIAAAYRGVRPEVFDHTAEQPCDVPVEHESFLYGPFRALTLGHIDEVSRAAAELAAGPFRRELLDIAEARNSGDCDREEKSTVSIFEAEPSHPEFALEYGIWLLRKKSKKALDILLYANEHSARISRSTVALCTALRQNGLIEQAPKVIKNALRKMPCSPQLYDRLADTYALCGRAEERVSALRQACGYAPKDLVRRERLVEALMAASLEHEALAEIASVEKTAGRAWSERLLSKVEQRKTRPERAPRSIDDLFDENAGLDPVAARGLADALLAAGEDARAVPHLEMAGDHESGTKYRMKLAEVEEKLGRPHRALSVLTEILANLEETRSLPPSAVVIATFDLLIQHPELGDLVTFVRDRANMLSRIPTACIHIWRTAKATRGNAELLRAAGDLLTAVIEEHPAVLQLLRARIDWLLLDKKVGSALYYARLLVADYPRVATAHADLGRCLAKAGEYRKAAHAYQAAHNLRPLSDEFARSAERLFRKAGAQSAGAFGNASNAIARNGN
jgi:glycosyltransferase involved in cell wall biosynthesis